MTIEPIGIFTLLISLFPEIEFIVYAFIASTLFGSAGAIILDSLGGNIIQPAASPAWLSRFQADERSSYRRLGGSGVRSAAPASGR
jgi:hypothetical protein